jgi:hypothetical protein
MKQHITGDDLHQLKLNDTICEKMDKLFHSVPEEERNYSQSHVIQSVDTGKEYRFPLLSISQMLAFLKENSKDYPIYRSETGDIYYQPPYINGINLDTFCDELWEYIKEILEAK